MPRRIPRQEARRHEYKVPIDRQGSPLSVKTDPVSGCAPPIPEKRISCMVTVSKLDDPSFTESEVVRVTALGEEGTNLEQDVKKVEGTEPQDECTRVVRSKSIEETVPSTSLVSTRVDGPSLGGQQDDSTIDVQSGDPLSSSSTINADEIPTQRRTESEGETKVSEDVDDREKSNRLDEGNERSGSPCDQSKAEKNGEKHEGHNESRPLEKSMIEVKDPRMGGSPMDGRVGSLDGIPQEVRRPSNDKLRSSKSLDSPGPSDIRTQQWRYRPPTHEGLSGLPYNSIHLGHRPPQSDPLLDCRKGVESCEVATETESLVDLPGMSAYMSMLKDIEHFRQESAIPSSTYEAEPFRGDGGASMVKKQLSNVREKIDVLNALLSAQDLDEKDRDCWATRRTRIELWMLENDRELPMNTTADDASRSYEGHLETDWATSAARTSLPQPCPTHAPTEGSTTRRIGWSLASPNRHNMSSKNHYPSPPLEALYPPHSQLESMYPPPSQSYSPMRSDSRDILTGESKYYSAYDSLEPRNFASGNKESELRRSDDVNEVENNGTIEISSEECVRAPVERKKDNRICSNDMSGWRECCRAPCTMQ